MAKVDVKKLKFKRNGGRRKKVRFTLESKGERRRGAVEEFPNLGMRVEWVDGKVIVHRNGRQEVYNDFNELRVPSRKGIRNVNARQPRPNARFFERNGVRYYHFSKIGVTVRSCITYWPEKSEAQPPEHLFGSASSDEVSELLEEIERRFRRRARKAVERAIKIVAERNGYELPSASVPVSFGLIEELRERGFDVKIKV